MTTLPKPLAATPPMGWNSWNTFGHQVEESVIREIADALVSSGFKDHRYEYIVIDDCRSVREGRDGNGDRVADQLVAVAVVNRGSRGEDIPVKARDLGLFDTSKLVRNLWTQQDISDFTAELTLRVQPHETILMKATSS